MKITAPTLTRSKFLNTLFSLVLVLFMSGAYSQNDFFPCANSNFRIKFSKRVDTSCFYTIQLFDGTPPYTVKRGTQTFPLNTSGSALSFSCSTTLIVSDAAGCTACVNSTGAASCQTNQITTGTVFGSPLCAGLKGLSIPFTVTGTFNTGNVFTAQLSDAFGIFPSNPVEIGSVLSTSSGIIPVNIPIQIAIGSGYRIRVVSNNPIVTGTLNDGPLSIIETKNNCTPSFAVAIVGTDKNAGIGCPNGATFKAIYLLDDCFTTWTIRCPECELLGQDSVWTGKKGEPILGTVPNAAAKKPAFQLAFLARADDLPNDALECGLGVSHATFDASINCNGTIGLNQIKPESFPGALDGVAFFTINVKACGPYVENWRVRLTSTSDPTKHFFGIGQTINDKLNVSNLPHDTYQVSFDYAVGLCFHQDVQTITIPVGLQTGPVTISASPVCPNRVIKVFQVPFTSSVNFSADNVFSVELSDENGDFSTNNPNIIGTVKSSASSGSVDASIPITIPGNRYRLRVRSSNPAITGTANGTNIIIQDGRDLDKDGVSVCDVPNDCNDNDATIFPGAPEICDGKDNNCDGQIDEGTTIPPFSISCLIFPCDNQIACKNTRIKYTVSPVQAGVTYRWTQPANATIISGQDQSIVEIEYSPQFTSGRLSVVGSNNCKSLQPAPLDILSTPPQPAIQGPASVCANSINTFSCSEVAGASTYRWRASGGAKFKSGDVGRTVTIEFKNANSTITVTPENTCGTGLEKSIPVKVNSCKQ